MDNDFVFRFRVTRAGLRRSLSAALMVLLPAHLLSQGDPGRTVTINTYTPSPVGAFSELQVNGAANIELARNAACGGVGIGGPLASVNNCGSPDPNAPKAGLTVMGSAVFGDNSPAYADTLGTVGLNIINNTTLGLSAGLSMDDLAGGARWVMYAANTSNAGNTRSYEMLWLWNSANPGRPGVWGVDSTGALHACTWNFGGCPAPRVSVFHGDVSAGGGPPTAGDAAQVCAKATDPTGLGKCNPSPSASSMHYCCHL